MSSPFELHVAEPPWPWLALPQEDRLLPKNHKSFYIKPAGGKKNHPTGEGDRSASEIKRLSLSVRSGAWAWCACCPVSGCGRRCH